MTPDTLIKEVREDRIKTENTSRLETILWLTAIYAVVIVAVAAFVIALS